MIYIKHPKTRRSVNWAFTHLRNISVEFSSVFPTLLLKHTPFVAGGEIVCSPVTCFRRDDCMPKYVPGRCCPEYDNCPSECCHCTA